MNRHPWNRHLGLALASALLGTLGACELVKPVPPDELDLWSDASAGVDDPEVGSVCTAFWESHLRAYPLQATFLRDPRYDSEVPEVSVRRREQRAVELDALARRARAVQTAGLSERDRLTLEILRLEIDKERTALARGLDTWTIDPLGGPHVEFLNVAQVQPAGTASERAALVERWRSIPHYVADLSATLRTAKRRGLVSSATAIEKQVAQLDLVLATPPMDSPLVALATGGGTWVELPAGGSVANVAHEHLGDARRQRELRTLNLHLQDGERLTIGTRVLLPAEDDPLALETRGRFLYDVLSAVEERAYPAFAAYRDLLLHDLQPTARGDDRPGLVHVGGGAEAYLELIHAHTSLPPEECDPKQIHEFGLSEVARIRGEIAALGEKLFGTRDVAAIQARLRGDPAMHFQTREEVRAKAVEALYRARARAPRFFGILPVADCEVVEIPRHEEQNATIAYYREPAPDGSLPGRYFVNTWQPSTRPRYEAEVLAYHEAIPGHHLQIAIAQELEDLPAFRRHLGPTAFVEGWALYTERLCDEMGLYSGDVDRMGVLSFDAWRACRLVVDTGLHAFGWSRERAIAYLNENTLLARNNVENEVDRYIAWPGQALAYKVGQREFLELRDEARSVLGSAFAYPEFHDRVLGNGAVPLATLRGIVRSWLGVPVAGTVEAGADSR